MRSLLVCAGLISMASLTACASILGDFAVGEDLADSGADAKTEDGHVADVAADTTVTADAGKDASDATSPDATSPDSTSPDATSPDATSDANDAGGTDAPADHTGDGNPCASPPVADFYVDPANGHDTRLGGGTSCALRTITAALTASASAAYSNATIHLAAGAYGANETFPLIVDHGRSLVGAGLATTKIQGSSAAYNTTGTKSFLDTGTHYLTVLAGDVMGGANAYGRTTLSGFTILPAASVTAPTTNYIGLACITGNAPNTGATPPLPPTNLLVQSVNVGPNYDVGVSIGSSPAQSAACNAVVLSSSFGAMNTGLQTGTCGTSNPVLSWPSAQIGDGVHSDANTFAGSVIDIFGGGCGSVQSINTNNFASGYRAIVLVSQPAQYFEILGNSFQGGAGAFPMGIGVQTSSTATINKLNANTFANIAQTAAADTAAGQTTGFALLVGSVLQAHQNVIHDNDNGVEVTVAPAVTFDFSSDGTPSNANEIYCNAKPPSAPNATGYDVLLNYSSGIPANFAGNIWDHATPVTGVSLTTSTNGTDLVTGPSSGATLTGSSTIGNTGCASGRTH